MDSKERLSQTQTCILDQPPDLNPDLSLLLIPHESQLPTPEYESTKFGATRRTGAGVLIVLALATSIYRSGEADAMPATGIVRKEHVTPPKSSGNTKPAAYGQNSPVANGIIKRLINTCDLHLSVNYWANAKNAPPEEGASLKVRPINHGNRLKFSWKYPRSLSKCKIIPPGKDRPTSRYSLLSTRKDHKKMFPKPTKERITKKYVTGYYIDSFPTTGEQTTSEYVLSLERR